MELKNKELEKLYDSITLYFDSWCLPSLITAFMFCDDAIEGEIAALKAELTDAKKGRAIFRGNADCLRVEVLEKGNELRKANNQIESLKKMIDEFEKEIYSLKKKIHELDEENSNLRATPFDTLEALKKENIELRNDNDALAKTAETYKKSFMEHYEELEAEKARLKEAYDIHETTIKRLKLLLDKEHIENEDLSYGHKFEFGDKVFVPWSCDPYAYIKQGMLYNPRTKSCVYVGKTQHLKWFGERFEIK